MKKNAPSKEVTRLLQAWQDGEVRVLPDLMETVLHDLRRIARAQLRKERGHHTLRTDALINETYMRLSAGAQPQFKDRVHFFGIASRIMRQVLVDYARELACEKRGGDYERLHLDNIDNLSEERALEILDLDEALEELSKADPMKGRIVELRYFAGLTIEETAQVLDKSVSTVKREWVFTKAALMKLMKGSPERN